MRQMETEVEACTQLLAKVKKLLSQRLVLTQESCCNHKLVVVLDHTAVEAAGHALMRLATSCVAVKKERRRRWRTFWRRCVSCRPNKCNEKAQASRLWHRKHHALARV
jgi:hypothetical protein